MTLNSGGAGGTVLIADFVNVDAAGKVNIVGGGIQFLGFDPATGMTAPFYVFVNITVSIPTVEATQSAVEVILIDADGQPVTLNGPEGQNTVLFRQDVDFRHKDVPNQQRPPMGFPGTSNFVLGFPGGLPLTVGSSYEWVVLLDGTRLAATTIFVPGPVAG
ncbi:hypothetical protein B5P43_36525 [Bacillus sp. SRB_336]|nr:hypothetical protein B5P43_36525 [Bacillus sp. SRB_336]